MVNLIIQRTSAAALVTLGLLAWSDMAPADQGINPADLKFSSADLIFKVDNLAGAVINLEVKETETEIKIELAGDVLFDFDKADIRKAAEPVLENVADLIKKYPKAVGRIEGHTDSKGDDNYNMRLSQKRAESIKQWLQNTARIDASKITTKGFGETKPTAPNSAADGSDDPDGRQKNRRVEIIVQKKA